MVVVALEESDMVVEEGFKFEKNDVAEERIGCSRRLPVHDQPLQQPIR